MGKEELLQNHDTVTRVLQKALPRGPMEDAQETASRGAGQSVNRLLPYSGKERLQEINYGDEKL